MHCDLKLKKRINYLIVALEGIFTKNEHFILIFSHESLSARKRVMTEHIPFQLNTLRAAHKAVHYIINDVLLLLLDPERMHYIDVVFFLVFYVCIDSSKIDKLNACGVLAVR